MVDLLLRARGPRDWALRSLLGSSLVFGCVMPDPRFREASTGASNRGASASGESGQDRTTETAQTGEAEVGGRDSGVGSESESSGIVGSEATATATGASDQGEAQEGATSTLEDGDAETVGTFDMGDEGGSTTESTETDSGSEADSEQGTATDTDSTTETETGGETGVDGGTLAAITLENPGREIIEPGIAVRLEFDHRALVADGAAIDGRDLRVFRLQQGNWGEVDRFLAHDSDWNREDTAIWFRSEIPLNASSTNNTDYWLKWGGERLSPAKADPRAIFALYDNFSQSRYAADGDGDWRLQVVSGMLILAANAPQGEHSWVEISYPDFEYQDPGMIVEAYARTRLPGASSFCGRSSMLEILDHERDQIRAALAVQSNELKLGTSSGQGAVFYPNGNPDSPGADEGWHVYGLRWYLSDIEGMLDGAKFDRIVSDPQWSTPDHGPVYPRVLFEVGGGLCELPLAGQIEIDWLRVRRSVGDHPRVSFP